MFRMCVFFVLLQWNAADNEQRSRFYRQFSKLMHRSLRPSVVRPTNTANAVSGRDNNLLLLGDSSHGCYVDGTMQLY